MTAVLLVLCASGSVLAQTSVRTLKPASATLDREFSAIGSMRELADGQVLVTDEGENLLLVVHMTRGTATAVSTVGGGPGEYRKVGLLVPMPGDSTLMPDAGSMERWLLLSGARVVATVTAADSAMRVAGVRVVGADVTGNVLASKHRPGTPSADGTSLGEVLFLRVARSSGRVDTLARGSGLLSKLMPSSGAGTTMRRMSLLARYSVPEQALMFPDGWVAVARQSPYRIEWYPPGGGPVRRGPVAPWTAPRITEAEKRAWDARVLARSGRTPQVGAVDVPWAEVVPPYRNDGLLRLPDGGVLVQKAEWSGSQSREYDLFDRAGIRTAVLRLLRKERILGFGRTSAYVVTSDEDGIERLSRHPWP